jgi:hypothetical protein
MIATGDLQCNILRRIAGGHIGKMSGIITVDNAVKFYRGFCCPRRAVFDIQIKISSEALPAV